MSEENIVSIEVTKKIPFFGSGDSLQNRLKNVILRGFPGVKIYQNTEIELPFLKSDQILKTLHTPQLRVYRSNIQRISNLAGLFKVKGIDILNLDYAYDYIAFYDSGQQTEWTMLPPIVECFFIPKTNKGKLDYLPIISSEIADSLTSRGLWLNPEIFNMNHTSDSGFFNLINDGMHRIHYGYENGGIKVIIIKNVTPGFPYYAAPQPYNIRVFDNREEALKLPETKVHIVQEPAHKDLYRIFPSGGIKSGNVRPH